MSSTLDTCVFLLLLFIFCCQGTEGSLVLSSSSTTATEGDNFTLICTSNTTDGDRYTIQWYRSGNLLFKTTYHPLQPCGLSEVNQIFYRYVYLGRTTASCDVFQHNVTVLINLFYDYGTFWWCEDTVRRQTSNTITINQPAVQPKTTSSFPPNSTVPTTSTVQQQTSTVTTTSTLPSASIAPQAITTPSSTTLTVSSTSPMSATPFAATFSTITTSATTVSAFEVQNLGLGVVYIIVGCAAAVLVIIVISVVVLFIRRRRHQTEVQPEAETSIYDNLTETPPTSYESIRVSPYQNSGAQYYDPVNYINIHVK